MKISILLNIFFIVAVSELTSLAFKNIDNEADNLIKLNSCQGLVEYQDETMRHMLVEKIIYED